MSLGRNVFYLHTGHGANIAPTAPDCLGDPRSRSRLTRRFDPLHRAGLVSLAEVGQHHCDTYLEEISWATTGTRRRMGPAVVGALVRCTQVLALYSDIISDTYTPGFRLWGTRGADDIAGYVRTNVNLVGPVPDALLRPLLADTLYLISTMGYSQGKPERCGRPLGRRSTGERCHDSLAIAGRGDPGL